MKTQFRKAVLFVMTACFLPGCGPDYEIIPPDPIGGLEPEVLIDISSRQLVPGLTGIMVVENDENKVFQLIASTSRNKAFQQRISILIRDEDLQVAPDGSLDYFENEAPVYVSTRYTKYLDEDNRNSDSWKGLRPDMGGIRLDSMYVEDDVTYASGRFFLNPANDELTPRVQIITGLFHNVRVFSNSHDMDNYFDRITELELSKINTLITNDSSGFFYD